MLNVKCWMVNQFKMYNLRCVPHFWNLKLETWNYLILQPFSHYLTVHSSDRQRILLR